ncbi:N-formylglutamate amidohydrolase [Marinobacter sp.]|uniref:N-formylglutamate amidohydrolase n=1 Tax=Marinobacter sp. TaxID=50741 RepID=UPI00384FF7B4
MKNHQSNTESQITAGSTPKTALASERPARLLNGNADSSLLLVCEHASNYIPPQFNDLGIDSALQSSHIAWDPGALAVANLLSKSLNAPVVASAVSRLVYDCNRPPEAEDAIPTRSEIYDIPGNVSLTHGQRTDRMQDFYLPFESLLANTLAGMPSRPSAPVLVTVHSFTPVYNGQRRTTEIGVLHDTDSRLADALLKLAPRHSSLIFRRNNPYGPSDGVTHTLKRHGVRNGLMNVMVEIRNDLITTADDQRRMADMIAGLLVDALTRLMPGQRLKVGSVKRKGGPECQL